MEASVKAVFQCVFAPRRLAKHEAGYRFVTRYGWILIVARWAYYSVLFQVRDYEGRWAPFVAPPFGINIDTYARLQRTLAVPFGIGLMLVLAVALLAYLRLIGATVPFATTFNVLGAAFFLPFVLLQPIDQGIIALIGWQLAPIAVLHTAVLVWESWAAVEVLSTSYDLSRAGRLGGMVVVCSVWILIAGSLWR